MTWLQWVNQILLAGAGLGGWLLAFILIRGWLRGDFK
jgi:hypothetical protein